MYEQQVHFVLWYTLWREKITVNHTHAMIVPWQLTSQVNIPPARTSYHIDVHKKRGKWTRSWQLLHCTLPYSEVLQRGYSWWTLRTGLETWSTSNRTFGNSTLETHCNLLPYTLKNRQQLFCQESRNSTWSIPRKVTPTRKPTSLACKCTLQYKWFIDWQLRRQKQWGISYNCTVTDSGNCLVATFSSKSEAFWCIDNHYCRPVVSESWGHLAVVSLALENARKVGEHWYVWSLTSTVTRVRCIDKNSPESLRFPLILHARDLPICLRHHKIVRRELHLHWY